MNVVPTAAELRQLSDQAIVAHRLGNLPVAEELLSRILAIEPGHFEANHLFGVIRARQERYPEALNHIGIALRTRPQASEALRHQGNVLMALGRNQDASTSYEKAAAAKTDFDRIYNQAGILRDQHRLDQALTSLETALAIRPYSTEAWNSRGSVLSEMGRVEEALACFERALAIEPDVPEGLYNRANALQDLKRYDEALVWYDRALTIRPAFLEALNNRGVTLWALLRFDEAIAAFRKALAIKPDFLRVLNNLGGVLCESDHIDEGLAVFTEHAHSVHQMLAAQNFSGEGAPPHKLRHDAEQFVYLADTGMAGGSAPSSLKFVLADGAKLPGPAVNPANAGAIDEQWRTKDPKIVVIDNLLTPEALEKLRRFCWGSTVWRRFYEDGYLGAMADDGFACPLLAQIAEELRTTFPAVFRGLPLCYLWAFKYDGTMAGTGIHGDQAAVNVNFWITPDEANLDPEHGGLVVWDKAAPLEWDFTKINTDRPAIHEFLAQQNAKSVTVPYRANRAVIFDSDLFHETDKIRFRDGYKNRRINVTLLYGRREECAE